MFLLMKLNAAAANNKYDDDGDDDVDDDNSDNDDALSLMLSPGFTGIGFNLNRKLNKRESTQNCAKPDNM